MSESSGHSAVGLSVSTGSQVEVKLTFESKKYSLHGFTTRLQDIESLMTLLLDGAPAPRKTLAKGIVQIQVNARTGKLSHGHHDPLKGVKVESVNLNSPLEVVLAVSGSLSAMMVLPKFLIALIDVKNKVHESSVIGAEASAKKKNLALEAAVVDHLLKRVSRLKLKDYKNLPADDPNKLLIKGAVRALDQLKDAKVREK